MMAYEARQPREKKKGVLCVCCVLCVCVQVRGELTVSYNWPGKLPGFYIHSTKKKKKKKKKTKRIRRRGQKLYSSFIFLNTFFIGLQERREGSSQLKQLVMRI